MSAETPPATNEWQRIVLWFVLGLGALFMVASFAGNGTGMFGWGFMMGMMWVWMFLPVLLIVLLVVLVTHGHGGKP